MNKLTKVGCSALCGSLAVISAANAGELTVTGGADLTFTSLGGGTTGNPFGMGSNITWKGSGELDNGWTFALTIADGNAGAYSASNINLDMQGLGKLNFNQGNSGNGIAAYDDKMPTAWEEAWGAGLGAGTKLVLGSGASQNVMYTTPKLAGTTIALTYAHSYGAADIADKTTGTTHDGSGRSYDVTININPTLGTETLSGLNIFAGASTIETLNNSDTSAAEEDQYQGVFGATLALGPVEVGAQASGLYTGEESTMSVYHTHINKAYAVAFNVNDDFSVSYGTYSTDATGYHDPDVQVGGEKIELSSWQAAYTMGGASFRVADTHATNANFVRGNTRDATTVSLGLAF